MLYIAILKIYIYEAVSVHDNYLYWYIIVLSRCLSYITLGPIHLLYQQIRVKYRRICWSLHNCDRGAPPLRIVQVWKIISQHQIIVQTWNFLCMTQTLVRMNEQIFKFFALLKIALPSTRHILKILPLINHKLSRYKH